MGLVKRKEKQTKQVLEETKTKRKEKVPSRKSK